MSKLSPSDTSAATRPAEPADSAESVALRQPSQQPGTQQHGRRISRVMLLQRELNDKPVPVPRPSAPTASAVARASAALRSHGVEPVGPECTDHVDLVLVLGVYDVGEEAGTLDLIRNRGDTALRYLPCDGRVVTIHTHLFLRLKYSTMPASSST